MEVGNVRNMEDVFKAINDNTLDQCLLLDVRSHEEFISGHIEGAQNLPHDSISPSEIEKLKNYHRIIVYCQMGGRAGIASQTLNSSGLNNVVCIDENGMGYWYEQGYPTV